MPPIHPTMYAIVIQLYDNRGTEMHYEITSLAKLEHATALATERLRDYPSAVRVTLDIALPSQG